VTPAERYVVSYATLSSPGEVLLWIGPTVEHAAILARPERATEIGSHVHLSPDEADQLAAWLRDSAARARRTNMHQPGA
jgi:hypothetical protein